MKTKTNNNNKLRKVLFNKLDTGPFRNHKMRGVIVYLENFRTHNRTIHINKEIFNDCNIKIYLNKLYLNRLTDTEVNILLIALS